MTNVSFIEESHTYINSKGIIIPSVSALIKFKYPELYKDIPPQILKNAATYGSKLHSLIEQLGKGETTIEKINEMNINPNIKLSCGEALRVLEQFNLKIKSQEQIVDFEERYAGTYDILTTDDFLVDIKTTAQVHYEQLEWQLSLYYMALGIDKEIGYCLYLPKGKCGELIEIHPRSKTECLELLENYEKTQDLQDIDF